MDGNVDFNDEMFHIGIGSAEISSPLAIGAPNAVDSVGIFVTDHDAEVLPGSPEMAAHSSTVFFAYKTNIEISNAQQVIGTHQQVGDWVAFEITRGWIHVQIPLATTVFISIDFIDHVVLVVVVNLKIFDSIFAWSFHRQIKSEQIIFIVVVVGGVEDKTVVVHDDTFSFDMELFRPRWISWPIIGLVSFAMDTRWTLE